MRSYIWIHYTASENYLQKLTASHLHPPPAARLITGTHDTNTIRGWFDKEESGDDRAGLYRYLGREVADEVHWEIIRMAMMSVAHTAIIQMQDLLGAGEDSRMNTPGEAEGNWQWRLSAVDLTAHASRLAQMTFDYGRAR